MRLRTADTVQATVLFQARVNFLFESSCEVELTIRVCVSLASPNTQPGDVIDVVRTDVGGGWWEGRLNGVLGLFPEAYIERVSGGSRTLSVDGGTCAERHGAGVVAGRR